MTDEAMALREKIYAILRPNFFSETMLGARQAENMTNEILALLPPAVSVDDELKGASRVSDVVKFPEPEKAPPLLIGPFEEYLVIVQGRAIPRLTGFKREDGSVSLYVDHRFGADFPNEEIAGQAAWLIAQAMAIGAGYSSCEAETRDRPFAPISMRLK